MNPLLSYDPKSLLELEKDEKVPIKTELTNGLKYIVLIGVGVILLMKVGYENFNTYGDV